MPVPSTRSAALPGSRRWLALAAACVAAAAAAPAGAQSACAARFPLTPTDTVHRVVRLTLGRGGPKAGTPMRGWAGAVMQGVATHFRAPVPLSVPELAQRRYYPDPKDSSGLPGIRGTFLLAVNRDGSLMGATMVASSGSPEVDAAFLRAAHAADSAHDLLMLPEGAASDAAILPVHVTTSEPPRATPSIPLFRLSLAYTRAPSPMLPVDKVSGAAPRYPDDLRSENVAGDVTAQFVVDTSGRARMSSVRILESSHTGFTQAVLAVLPSYRFKPASDEGCPMEQLVQLPFQFRLAKGVGRPDNELRFPWPLRVPTP